MAKKKIKIDDSGIPAFLRVTVDDLPRRKKANEDYFKSHKLEIAKVVYDPRKPASMTTEEWEKAKAKVKAEADRIEAARKAKKVPKALPVDIAGKVWDVRKSRWVEDSRPQLSSSSVAPVPAPKAQPKPAPKRPVKVVAGSFGIPPGTNREKLAKAMAKRIGELVPLTDWSVEVYGVVNANACDRVMNGFILDLQKRNLKFEIIKDKVNGVIVYGLFEI